MSLGTSTKIATDDGREEFHRVEGINKGHIISIFDEDLGMRVYIKSGKNDYTTNATEAMWFPSRDDLYTWARENKVAVRTRVN